MEELTPILSETSEMLHFPELTHKRQTTMEDKNKIIDVTEMVDIFLGIMDAIINDGFVKQEVMVRKDMI
jgi:hypothetical protein